MSRSTRQAGHVAANAVALAYLVGGAVRIVVHSSGGPPDWLLVHVLLLGAVTNAIVTWSSHFATALLQQPQHPVAATVVRLVALNAGVLGVLVGVNEGSRAATIGAAALLMLVLAVHLASLVRTGHAGRTRRFAPMVRFYWAAACAVLLGAGAGLPLMLGELSGAWYERVYLAHVHLGLLGWVTLTVLGTEFTLWPIALRTRMVAGLERVATVCLLCCTAGLALLVGGLLWWVRPVAVTGLLLYVVGVGVSLDPFLRTVRRRGPRSSPATVMLAASTGWLLIGLVYDAAAVAPLTRTRWLRTSASGRRTAAAVNRWGFVTAALVNIGVVLLAVGGLTPTHLGWLLTATAIALFFVSVLSAAVVRVGGPGLLRRAQVVLTTERAPTLDWTAQDARVAA